MNTTDPATSNLLKRGFAILSDLPGWKPLNPKTVEGWDRLERYGHALAAINATGLEFVAACEAHTAEPNAFPPTPQQIAARIRETRLQQAQNANATAWKDVPRVAPPEVGGDAQVPAGFGQRSQLEFYAKVQGIIRRGHAGTDIGEPYVAAVLREEAEEAAALAAGKSYTLRRYGPSLIPRGGAMASALAKSMSAGQTGRVSTDETRVARTAVAWPSLSPSDKASDRRETDARSSPSGGLLADDEWLRE